MTTYENICKVASNAVNKNKSVKFNDNVEKVEYEKPDYVHCSRQRKKSSNAGEDVTNLATAS